MVAIKIITIGQYTTIGNCLLGLLQVQVGQGLIFPAALRSRDRDSCEGSFVLRNAHRMTNPESTDGGEL